MSNSLRVLLVEDSPTDAEMVRILLDKALHGSYRVRRVATLSEAVAEVHEHPYDVVLQDLCLPDSKGLEAVRRLKEAKPHLPIVVLSGDESDEVALEAIRSGAQEYLSKSHLAGQLLTRVIHHSIARQEQLIEAQVQALIDPLAGIGNRRAFDLELSKQVTDFRRNGSPCTIALLDLDHFKRVNDQLGHDRGDEVLRITARTLARSLRDTDLVARYGGEEFGLVLSGTRLSEAERVIQRARQAQESIDWSAVSPTIEVTFSGGAAEMEGDETEKSILRRADAALYAAKNTGRDCFRISEGKASRLKVRASI